MLDHGDRRKRDVVQIEIRANLACLPSEFQKAAKVGDMQGANRLEVEGRLPLFGVVLGALEEGDGMRSPPDVGEKGAEEDLHAPTHGPLRDIVLEERGDRGGLEPYRFEEERVLAAEVVVEGRLGAARLFDDLTDRSRGVPSLRELPNGRAENALAQIPGRLGGSRGKRGGRVSRAVKIRHGSLLTGRYMTESLDFFKPSRRVEGAKAWPMRALHGHLWTVGPYLRHVVRPAMPPPAAHFELFVPDPRFGRVRLTGRYARHPSSDALVVVIHGLGGSSASFYAHEAAAAAHRAGLSSLRLNLRGADRRGEDYYHAGLTSDLDAVLATATVRRYREVYLLGFSLGGHLTLRYVALGPDPRVRAAAAICPPVDLARSAAEIDRKERTIYRAHVLRGLKEMYAQVAERRETPIPLAEARRIDTIRAWDEYVVAPRHGFLGAEDYWAKASAAPLLPRIATPTLVVATELDPMVIGHTVRPVLIESGHLRTVWLPQGGHVGFPSGLDLGFGRPGTVLDQTIGWLRNPDGSERREEKTD